MLCDAGGGGGKNPQVGGLEGEGPDSLQSMIRLRVHMGGGIYAFDPAWADREVCAANYHLDEFRKCGRWGEGAQSGMRCCAVHPWTMTVVFLFWGVDGNWLE
mgnify:CR=1 FL=1